MLLCLRFAQADVNSIRSPRFASFHAKLLGFDALPANEKSPAWGPCGRTVGAKRRPAAQVAAKWPFDAFSNRDSLPLTAISRAMAA